MRLAVESGDRTLFDKLQKSLTELKTPEGLLLARLHPDRTQDEVVGSSWADAIQDISLALIEAGEAWDLPEYTEQGVNLAEAFAESSHIKRFENGSVLVFNTPEMAISTALGDRLQAIDLSMLNLKLYNKMRRLSDSKIWSELGESSERLYRKTLENYKLPPNRLLLLDGVVIPLHSLKKDMELLGTISDEGVRKYIQKYRPEWDWDSMRTPYRLSDSDQEWAGKIADEIYTRINDVGGSRTHIYADTGESHPDG